MIVFIWYYNVFYMEFTTEEKRLKCLAFRKCIGEDLGIKRKDFRTVANFSWEECYRYKIYCKL